MRHAIIKLLFRLLSRKEQKRIIKHLSYYSIIAVKTKTSRRGPRGPYKKRLKPVEVTLPAPSTEERAEYRKKVNVWQVEHPETSGKKLRGKYYPVLHSMKRGESKIFFTNINTICPSISIYKNKYGGDFQTRTVGKNAVEVTRTL